MLHSTIVSQTRPSTMGTLSSAIQPFIDRGTLAGAIALAADHERILSIDCFGWADIEARKPMRPDTMVWIASQSKSITAMLLMMVVETGAIELDAPLETYLPEFKNQWLAAESDDDHILLRKPVRKPTVRDTLCHLSGMGTISALETPVRDHLPLEVRVRGYAMTPLQTEPGSTYCYSNQGINTAGRLVEVGSGMPFASFLRERLTGPLGLADTTFFPTVEQEARIAKAYRPNAGGTALEEYVIDQQTHPRSVSGRYPVPANGLYSTAADCARICQVALNQGEFEGHRYMARSTHREMLRRQTPLDQQCCGLGWHPEPDHYGHGGALSTGMWIYPDRDRILVWLPQAAGFLGDGAQALDAFKSAALQC